MEIFIRKAVQADTETVYRFLCDLENEILPIENFRSIFNRNCLNPQCIYIVALHQSEIIGFISLHIQELLHHAGPVGEVQEFYVVSDYRSMGAGRSLLNRAELEAALLGAKECEVTFNQRRTFNVVIYESMGYELTHHKMTKRITD